MCPQESSVSRLQPAACVFQQPRAKEFLGADGSPWYCIASWLPLGFPFPRLPCRRSMLQVQDSPLCTQHSPGRGLHPGVDCGSQILTGERSRFLGRSCPSPSTQTLVSWRGHRHQARRALEDKWSLLLPLLPVPSLSCSSPSPRQPRWACTIPAKLVALLSLRC